MFFVNIFPNRKDARKNLRASFIPLFFYHKVLKKPFVNFHRAQTADRFCGNQRNLCQYFVASTTAQRAKALPLLHRCFHTFRQNDLPFYLRSLSFFQKDIPFRLQSDRYLLCSAQNDGTVGSRKSVNIPGVRISLPAITERDREFIALAATHSVDFIAHSFVRSRADVLAVQEILDELKSPIKIIAKIENQEGVDNADEILDAAFGIMVARGDLGIEVPQEKIPGIQRVLIKQAVQHKKPVIVATQMLHSMIHNPRPTRAEITDIANAIYYRTDAVMLSGETAYGKYPVEAVRTMTKTAYEAEKTKLAENDIRVPYVQYDDREVTEFLAKQAVKATMRMNVKAIVTDSHTGRTARVLAAFRGKSTVYAIATSERLARELALSYGVWAEYQQGKGDGNTKESRRAYFVEAIKRLLERGLIERKDRVAYLGGSFGEVGGTTYLEIIEAWRILEAKERYNLPDYTQ